MRHVQSCCRRAWLTVGLDELAIRVAREVGGHAVVKPKLGKDIKWTRHWFDIKYPDNPPPEYARNG